MKDFVHLVELASERLGGRVLASSDEFFAPKENLIKPTRPIFIEEKYTDRGKWMDGWETRRRRSPGFDWCILQLGYPGVLRGIVVDTSHFKGNYPEHCSLDACAFDIPPEIEALTGPEARWCEVLPKSALKGDAQNLFPVENESRFTHLRFKIYPDGGVARLRVHGEAVPDWTRLLTGRGDIDLVAMGAGGRPIASSDEFFSSPRNLLLPGKAPNMGEGWETRRRRGPGHDWVVLKLGIPGYLHRVEIDTSFFKGNFPESCSLEVCDTGGRELDLALAGTLVWKEILRRMKLAPDSVQIFDKELCDSGPATHVRFSIFPDGGVSRLRLYGTPQSWQAGLRRLNALPKKEACAVLLECCGSTRWAREVAEKLPLAHVPQLFEAANHVWMRLERKDWLEAFSRHPQIGESKAAGQGSAARDWSVQEQSGLRDASAETQVALEEANRQYLARFGYIFIICATGRSSREMLVSLKKRLKNDAENEIQVAAEEQRAILQLRLGKLLDQ